MRAAMGAFGEDVEVVTEKWYAKPQTVTVKIKETHPVTGGTLRFADAALPVSEARALRRALKAAIRSIEGNPA